MASGTNGVIGSSGPDHPRWKGGKHVTSKGYVRIKSGPYRDWYEHIAVMHQCMNQLYPGSEIPAGMEVHHFDADRQHNCPCNLMLLDERIHHAIEASKRMALPWYEKHLINKGVRQRKKKRERKCQ